MPSDDRIGVFREHGSRAPLRAIGQGAAADCRSHLESDESETGAAGFETLRIKLHLYFT